MNPFTPVETSQSELTKYRIILFISAIAMILFGLFYSVLPGAIEPMIDRYIFAFVTFLIFFILMASETAQRYSYYLFYVASLYIVGQFAFITVLNSSRVEYAIGYACVYLLFATMIKTFKHLVIYTTAINLLYITLSLGLYLRGASQNMYSVALIFILVVGIFLWLKAKIEKDRVVNNQVHERTKELLEEQIKLKAAIGAVNGVFVIIDPHGNVILSNNKYAEVLGINYEPRTIQELQQVFGGSYDVSGAFKVSLSQVRIIDHSSVEFKDKYLRVLFSPVYESQFVMGILILIGDVTEEELLDRARDEFFAIASHELRTPLTAIQGNVALVLEYMDSEKLDKQMVREMLQDAMSSSQRLIRLVHDFLDLSRLEQGRVKFEEQHVDLVTLAKQVLVEYSQAISSKGLTYSFQNNATLSKVFADEDRVKQVIVNLVSNAVKYTDKGSINIYVQTKDQNVELIVADTGTGIPDENQKFLFRKFQQAGKNVLTRDTSQGTGLGLYISRLITRAMGGDVYLVYSQQGKGSAFAFSLPAKE